MTHITVCPVEEGKWVMKSIVKSSQTWVGVGNGWSNLLSFVGRYLHLWHVEQC